MLLIGLCFFIFLLAGIPIAFVIGMATVPYVIINDMPLNIIAHKMFTGLNSFIMVSLPFFILASNLMNSGGITRRIVEFVNSTLGHIRGGLAYVNVGVSMVFAGLTGMASADTAAVGTLLIPAMKKEGYDADFSAAVTASSSTIGPIIPPSFLFIVFSLVVGGVSVAALFLAGIIPGILLGLFQMIVVAYYSAKRGYPRRQRVAVLVMLKNFIMVLPALLIPVIMIGGLVFGVFTATEAADIACVAALFVSIFLYRELKISQIFNILVETGVMVGSLMLILCGATVFAWVTTAEQFPHMAAQFIGTLSSNPIVILLIMNTFLLVVGTIMDPTPSMIILAPILLPIALDAGVGLIQFGVMITLNLVIGLTTPPMGVCLFIASSISKVSIGGITRAMWPFLVSNTVVLLMVTFVPWITNFVPRLLLQ